MGNEKDKVPERVWINSLPESGRVTAYVSPIREVGSGRCLSLAEYVRADLLATVCAEEREAAFNNLMSVIKKHVGSCPGHAQLQMLAALEEAKQHTLAVDESGWLLEKMHNGNVHYIAADYVLEWTDDPNKALRLARREDAEALTTIVEDCERIAEHGWPTTTATENRKGEG